MLRALNDQFDLALAMVQWLVEDKQCLMAALEQAHAVRTLPWPNHDRA